MRNDFTSMWHNMGKKISCLLLDESISGESQEIRVATAWGEGYSILLVFYSPPSPVDTE
jgi:hypothetical protein